MGSVGVYTGVKVESSLALAPRSAFIISFVRSSSSSLRLASTIGDGGTKVISFFSRGLMVTVIRGWGSWGRRRSEGSGPD